MNRRLRVPMAAVAVAALLPLAACGQPATTPAAQPGGGESMMTKQPVEPPSGSTPTVITGTPAPSTSETDASAPATAVATGTRAAGNEYCLANAKVCFTTPQDMKVDQLETSDTTPDSAILVAGDGNQAVILNSYKQQQAKPARSCAQDLAPVVIVQKAATKITGVAKDGELDTVYAVQALLPDGGGQNPTYRPLTFLSTSKALNEASPTMCSFSALTWLDQTTSLQAMVARKDPAASSTKDEAMKALKDPSHTLAYEILSSARRA